MARPNPTEPFNPEPPGPHQPYSPPAGRSPVTSSPGFLTSTGGLTGTNLVLLMPIIDFVANKTSLQLFDPTNFDTEEAAYYYYKQEDVVPNRKVSIHKLIVTYRELAKCTFSVGVVVYIRETDTYVSKQVQVTVPPTKVVKGRTLKLLTLPSGNNTVPDPFPSNKLRSQNVDLVITGERPQVFWSRNPNSGPVAIARILMAGKMDEANQL